MKITIRKAFILDLENILKLHVLLYKHHQKYDQKIKIDPEVSRKWLEKKFKTQEARMWAIETNKEIRGYILCEQEKEKMGVISEIYISPILRNRGLGKRLLGVALNYLRKIGMKKVLTATPVESKESKKFWISLGFRTSTVIKSPDPVHVYYIKDL